MSSGVSSLLFLPILVSASQPWHNHLSMKHPESRSQVNPFFSWVGRSFHRLSQMLPGSLVATKSSGWVWQTYETKLYGARTNLNDAREKVRSEMPHHGWLPIALHVGDVNRPAHRELAGMEIRKVSYVCGFTEWGRAWSRNPGFPLSFHVLGKVLLIHCCMNAFGFSVIYFLFLPLLCLSEIW